MNEPRQYQAPSEPRPRALTDEQRASLRRAKAAAVIVGVALPVAAAFTAAIVLITWLPLTPDPVATHWSGSEPDGFTSAGGNIFLVAGMSAGLGLLMGGIAVFGSGRGSIAVWSSMNRFIAAVGLSVSLLIALLGVFSTHMQLGLTDARLAGSVNGALGLAAGISIGAGVLGYFVQPKVYIAGGEDAPTSAIALTATERAVWVGKIRPSRGLAIVLAVTLVSLLVGAFTAWKVAPEPAVLWILVGLVVLIAALSACTLWFRVRIDATGLEARSFAGWPVFRVPAAEVAHVAAGHINPMADFGGWGMRWAPGRFGLVMRTGEGVVVTRQDGRVFAMTIDDSATAAGLLKSYATAHKHLGDNA